MDRPTRFSSLPPDQIGGLRLRLEQRRDQLQTTIRNDTVDPDKKDLAETVPGVRDPADDSLALQLSDMSISATEKAMAELRSVEAALVRMDEGTYGVCMDCGGEIPRERLEAYPTAERCTPCQERRENLRRDTSPSL